MIAPASRLLFWFALAALPLAALVPTSSKAAAALALLVLVAIVDAALSARALAGIAVELPALVRLTANRDAIIDVLLSRSAAAAPRHLRLLLPLARELGGSETSLPVLLPAETPRARIGWPCRPKRRGLYKADRVCLEAASPLGFWVIRRCLPARADLRVYPNLWKERRAVASIFLRRALPGVHAARQVGRGRDFEKLREYIPGDSFDEIHWKATAKRARPVTKIFQIERTQQIYAVVDASRLSGRPAPAGGADSEATSLDRSVVAALVLGLAAERQGDLFGLVAFTDRITRFLPARNGRAQFNACRDALFALEPESVSPDFDEVVAYLRLHVRRRALLVFFSDLDDPALAESFVRNVGALARQHVVLVAMRRPPDAELLFARETVADVDEIYRRLAGDLSWHGLRELEGVLRAQGVELALLDDERLAAEVVGRYQRIKQRQAL
jgi:uncharacterized protein (DUF58 family)